MFAGSSKWSAYMNESKTMCTITITLGVEHKDVFCSSEDRTIAPPAPIYWSMPGPLLTVAPPLKRLILVQSDPTRFRNDQAGDDFLEPGMDELVHPWWLFIQLLKRLDYLDLKLPADQEDLHMWTRGRACLGSRRSGRS